MNATIDVFSFTNSNIVTLNTTTKTTKTPSNKSVEADLLNGDGVSPKRQLPLSNDKSTELMSATYALQVIQLTQLIPLKPQEWEKTDEKNKASNSSRGKGNQTILMLQIYFGNKKRGVPFNNSDLYRFVLMLNFCIAIPNFWAIMQLMKYTGPVPAVLEYTT